MSILEQKTPYGIENLTDFDTLSKSDEFYPFSSNNAILDEKVVSFMLRLGYVFDYTSMCWYDLNRDGLYYPVSEDIVKREIMRFLNNRAPSGVNIPVKNTQSIYERLKACSFSKSCDDKLERFLIDHFDYDVSPSHDNADIIGVDLIPVKNGLINPETMELLPHCAYYLHHTVYNFNYQNLATGDKLTESDILSCPEFDTYRQIIPDIPTLKLFLWWVGMVLFSPELPRVLMFLYGDAGTGKTTLSLGVSEILTPSESLQLNYSALKNSQFLTSSFAGKKLIVIDEMMNASGLLDDSLFKQLTGGTSNFTIEEKYKQPRNVKLMSKLLMIGNTYPQFAQDNALYDRFFIIPCDIKQDSGIRDLVRDDDHKNWLFNAGYYYYVIAKPHRLVKSLSLLRTPLMNTELDQYRDTDPFNYWLKSYLGIDDLNRDSVRSLLDHQRTAYVFSDYQNWVLTNGGKPKSQINFNLKLRQEYGIENTTAKIDGIACKVYVPTLKKGGKK